MASDQERNRINGGCACGAIRFAFYEPLLYQAACHCRSCQYTSGGGPSYAVGVVRQNFRVTRGRPTEFTTLSEAGNLVIRAFCNECGTQLYSQTEDAPDVCAVKVGALDDPSSFKPRMQIWTSEAPAWHKLLRLVPKFRRNPPPTGKHAAMASEG